MSNEPTAKRKTVELGHAAGPRPSRIRREPPAPPPQQRILTPHPTERETWTVIIGIALFGLAIFVIILGFSDMMAG